MTNDELRALLAEFLVMAQAEARRHPKSADCKARIDRITAALAENNKDVTVTYHTSTAETELAIRQKLIELGWTPPLPERKV